MILNSNDIDYANHVCSHLQAFSNISHLKFFLQSPQAAEFPLRGGFPVTRDLLHCLHIKTPHALQFVVELDAHPDEYLHISSQINYVNSHKEIRFKIRFLNS